MASTQGDPAAREEHALQEVTDRLRRTFADSYSPDQVTDTVANVHRHFDERPIRDFVPVLVERIARDRLRATD
ncbi:three-helix bundle dimerization domain-containing protein [Spirillospora sp. CA-255316]